MGIEGLGSLLVRSGALAPERLSEAERRHAVYGGTLETVLLEMGAVEERTLLVHLAEATGMAAALPERLGTPDRAVADRVPALDARRLGMAPVGLRGESLELALRPGADRDAVAAWARERGIAVEPVVVPDVRLRELHWQLYGDQMPPRLVALLGRLIGAEQARRSLMERVPVTAMRSPPVETGPARRPPRAEGPLLLDSPPVSPPVLAPVAPVAAALPMPSSPDVLEAMEIEIVEEPPPPPAGPPADELIAALVAAREPLDVVRAMRALGKYKVERAVPLLIERIEHADRTVASAAQAALVTITGQDRGVRARGWRSWWSKAGDRDRVEWLLEALASSRAELRLGASDELRALTGMYFGYHFDLPERDREEARRRWADWWRTVGRPREAK